MKLVFGDPESIKLRDKARHEAMFKTCETCQGIGLVSVDYRCQESKHCEKGWHEAEVECVCCEGEGEIERK